MNYLYSVLWDYPELADDNKLIEFIEENKNNKKMLYWLLRRFLENGRVKDTLKYFKLSYIKDNIYNLKLSDYANKKWKRMIEIYGNKRKY